MVAYETLTANTFPEDTVVLHCGVGSDWSFTNMTYWIEVTGVAHNNIWHELGHRSFNLVSNWSIFVT